MLGRDAREKWNGNTMPDARVTHYWDGNLQIGQWFAKQVDGYDGVAWDIYYLFGPDATWETVPTPLMGEGITIYGERETLEMQVHTLLAK
jgi:hypothetical protein